VKEAVKSGVFDMKILREKYSNQCARYPKFITDYINDNRPVLPVPIHPLRPWQQTLYDDLAHEPCARKIIFIVDTEGNQGKSWFAHYYMTLFPDNSQLILPGKKADMAYALQETVRTLFVDCPRSKQGEYIQYDFLEEVKNGFVFSTKYASQMKRLQKVHVVVFMNEQPDAYKLSHDRYDVRTI